MRSLPRVLRAAHSAFAVILLSAAACEKSKPPLNLATAILPEHAAPLDLGANPQILFQVFGDADNARMMPIAAVVNGVVKSVGLTAAGWKALDAKYMAPGTKYSFALDSGNSGELTVARDTSYALPGCGVVKPMSVVQLAFKTPRTDPTVEFVVSSGPLLPPRPDGGTLMAAADLERLARSIGRDAGKRANLSAAELDSLDFNARMVPTGATAAPTMLISFIDPNAGNRGTGAWTGHVFALADSGANGYAETYVHAVKGDAKTVEFQRLVNHVDVNGDGTDELIVEAWKYAADNDLVMLSFKAGRWQEILRVRQDWCLSSALQR